MLDALRKLDRIDKRPLVDNRQWIEDCDVGKVSRLQDAPALETEDFRGFGSHLPNCVFKCKSLRLADVLSEHARKRTKHSRMRLATKKSICAYILFRPSKEADDMLFQAIEIDHAHCIFFRKKQIECGIQRTAAAQVANFLKALPNQIPI